MRSAIAIALWLGGVAGYVSSRSPTRAPVASAPALDQDSMSYKADTTPQRASLARRLAEAADGYRDGKLKWFVADRNFPHSVVLVLEDTTKGQDSLTRLIRLKKVPTSSEFGPADYRLYGPFQTPRDTNYKEIRGEEIASIVVTTVNGKRTMIDPQEYDAMFWGISAFDKFVTPYLTVVYGADFAAHERQLYLIGKSPYTHSTQATHQRSSF